MPEEELINDNEQELEPEVKSEAKPARSDNRFKDLSEKVETAAKERDAAKATAEAAVKEVEFYKDFSKLKYQGKEDFQDKIKEKVLAGYEMEDAAISVLAKAGKLNAPQAERESPAGGSAANSTRDSGEKSPGQMTREELREKLLTSEHENPGSLANALRQINL